MSDCLHNDLKRTTDKTDQGDPIYYCPAKCGAGLFVVTPLHIEVHYGYKYGRTGHYIVKCSCGFVIYQCRCNGPKKEYIEQNACPDCVRKRTL